MKLKALSNYDGDKSTRFGDCILIYDLTSMIVYDCGHGKHAEYVESFLQKNAIAFGVLAVAYMSLVTAIKILYIPLVYLVIMWFVTKKAAKSRANRIVVLVIKNAVQGL